MLTKSNFKCDRFCGKCCILPTVKLSNKDYSEIKKLGYGDKDFLDNGLIETDAKILKKTENGCIFLNKDKKGRYSCKIYNHRPKTCRIYPFFDNKAIKSCYPEDMFPGEFFSFKPGKFISKQ